MKYFKILGLLAVAAAAVMAFAGSASATIVQTTTNGAAATPTIHAIHEGKHVTLDSPVGKIECASTVEGKVESHGGAGVPAAGKISKLEFAGCTEGWHVTVIANGSLAVEWTSGYNGALNSTGAEVSATVGGITCVYFTNNTPIGTVTGGNPATLHITASIPINAAKSSIFCGTQPATWTGSYKTTSELYVGKE